MGADVVAVPAGTPRQVRGTPGMAEQALTFSGRSRSHDRTMVNRAVGIVVATRPPVHRGDIVASQRCQSSSRFSEVRAW